MQHQMNFRFKNSREGAGKQPTSHLPKNKKIKIKKRRKKYKNLPIKSKTS